MNMNFRYALIICCYLFSALSAFPLNAQPFSKAVILEYSRIGEDSFSRTNISLSQFENHIRELKTPPYTVLSLKDALAAFEEKKPLPENTVILTFDGGYKESLESAMPILDKAGLPYTVFFAPKNASLNAEAFLNWKDIKQLAKKKNVTLGIHPDHYIRLAGKEGADIRASVNNAKALFREKLGYQAQYFAYPFGEYSKAYRDIIAQSGFESAVSLNSGPAYEKSDLYALPRFAMSESFGALERFRLIVKTYPLQISSFEPEDPYITTNTPTIGFSLVDPTIAPENLSCFITALGRIPLHFIDKNRVELRPDQALSEARSRVNCTYPMPHKAPGDEQRWKWFGVLLTQAQ